MKALTFIFRNWFSGCAILFAVAGLITLGDMFIVIVLDYGINKILDSRGSHTIYFYDEEDHSIYKVDSSGKTYYHANLRGHQLTSMVTGKEEAQR